MPIDPNIALGVRPVELESPINAMAKIYAIKNAAQENQMRQMQMQQLEESNQRQNALRAALQGVDITSPEGLAAARNAYVNAGDVKGYHELATGQAALSKAQREADAAKLKLASDQIDLGLRYLSSAVDQPTYDAARQAMQGHGIDVSTMPAAFDPAYKQSELMKGISAKDQLRVHMTDLGGVVQPVRELTGEATGKALIKTATPGELLTDKRLREKGVDAASHPLLNQAILEGRVPVSRVNSRTAAIFESALQNDPGADLTALNVEQLGTAAGARTAGTTKANIGIASDEANRMIDVTRGIIPQVNLSDYPSLNAIQNAVTKGTGGVGIVKLNTALNSLINSYSRAINPKGVATVSDKNHAREIINSAMSKGQLAGALEVMQAEMEAALGAATAATKPRGRAGEEAPKTGARKTASGVSYTVED